MDNNSNLAQDLIANRNLKSDPSERFKKFSLNFNPFPRAGISDLNSSAFLIKKLEPVDKQVKEAVGEYIVDSLFPQNTSSSDKYLSAVVRGEYGMGKTQTLLYAKLVLESFSEIKDYNKKPYVVYIDNPGAKLSELIGSIISQIGEENFKRYLWNIAFEGIAANKKFKDALLNFKPLGVTLFDSFENHVDPFDAVNLVNYKTFLDAWYSKVFQFSSNTKKKKEFLDTLKDFIVTILTNKFENSTVALYFYELLSENIGINKTWEMITSGSAKGLEKKEVYIIRAIVKLIEDQGFSDFYILVDEFEAVTAGRLSTSEIDRYVTNLRALIDKERNWCAMFAMTGFALSRLKNVSPPLAERISSRVIELKNLNLERSKKLTVNYLNLARKESNLLTPFDETAIEALRAKSQGILRVFLKSCYTLLQRASEELKKGQKIDSAFVNKYFQVEEE